MREHVARGALATELYSLVSTTFGRIDSGVHTFSASIPERDQPHNDISYCIPSPTWGTVRVVTIVSVGRAFPAHRVDQATVTRTLGGLWNSPGMFPDAVRRLHRASGVETRHFVLPIEEYLEPRSFTTSNDVFIEEGITLGEAATRDALSQAGLVPADVDFVILVSTSGVSTPSIDAYLVSRVGFRPDVKRLPMFGLGCAGGAAGIARGADLLRGNPDAVALVVAVELCSLTFQREDDSVPNLVATSLFGDGAGAAVMVGARHARATLAARPCLVAVRSRIHAGTEGVLGWRIGENGFRVVLGSELPEVVCRDLDEEVHALLSAHGVTRNDVAVWAVHPGGPRVLRGVASALGLSDASLAASWESLRRLGNVSSASVLFVVGDLMATPPPPGSHGVLIGMGPGLTIETALLRWS